MYINTADGIRWLNSNFNSDSGDYVVISEFIPPVTSNGVPVTQMADNIGCYSVFGSVFNRSNTTYNISILDFEDWKTLLYEYMQSLGIPTTSIGVSNTNLNELYQSYVTATRDLRISGVVDMNVGILVPGAEMPFVWCPIGGNNRPVDILTYMSIFRKTFTHMCMTYGALKYMYESYLSSLKNSHIAVGTQYPNELLSVGNSLEDISNNMDTIITNTIKSQNGGPVTTNELRQIIESNGNSPININNYYQYMVQRFGFDSMTAIEMLYYASDIIDINRLLGGNNDTSRLVISSLRVPNSGEMSNSSNKII